MKFKPALLGSLALAAAGNAMACYTVYDHSNSVVYNAQTPPVDMSLPLHQTLPGVFPGGHMVFDAGGQCPSDQPLPRVTVQGIDGASPLLTDRKTAQAMNAPHTVLASGAALIARRPDAMSSAAVVDLEPDTRTMGAGPARPRGNTVITEMRDGMTVVQSGNQVIIRK